MGNRRWVHNRVHRKLFRLPTHKELQRKQQQEQHEKYIKEKTRLLQAAEEKMKKADKIIHENGHISKKETKAKANKMFMTKSKDTSQKAVQRAAKAIEHRVEQLKSVEAPKEENPLRFYHPHHSRCTINIQSWASGSP